LAPLGTDFRQNLKQVSRSDLAYERNIGFKEIEPGQFCFFHPADITKDTILNFALKLLH